MAVRSKTRTAFVSATSLNRPRRAPENTRGWPTMRGVSVQNSKRRVGEGYAVRPVGLHPVRWNGPHAALKVELFPSGAPGLYRAGGGQDEELQAAGRAVGLRSKTRHQRRKFLPSSRQQSSSFNRRIDPSSRAGVSESADRIAPRNVFASTFSWKEAPCGFRRRSRDPSWAGILKRDGPLAPESPTGHRILPVCDFIQESGQWIAEPSEKRPWGGIWDSGVATVECDSHTNGGSSGSSGRMRRSFRRSSSAGSGRSFRSSDDPRARAVGFLMSLYQRRLASSTYAMRRSLENRATPCPGIAHRASDSPRVRLYSGIRAKMDAEPSEKRPWGGYMG